MPKPLIIRKRIPCVVPNCPSLWKGQGKGTDTDIIFFSFPGPRRSKVWLKACNREDLLDLGTWELNNKFKICELHFEEKYFAQGGRQNSLTTLAVPTIFPTVISNPIKVKTDNGMPQIPNGIMVQNIDYTTPPNQTASIQHTPIQVFKVDIKGQSSVLTPVNVGLDDIKQMTPIPGPFASTTSLFRLQEFARTFYSGQNNLPNHHITMNESKSSSSQITEKASVQGCANEFPCLFTPPHPPLDQRSPSGPIVSTKKLISKSILRKHILSRKKASQTPESLQSEILMKLHRIKSLQRQVVVRVTKSLEVNV